MPKSKMVITDLDGTLAGIGSRITATDRGTLESLGRNGFLRVVATGRSLHATRKVLSPDFPIDYLVFSSGAGIYDWKRSELLKSESLPADTAQAGFERLASLSMDFMIHHAIPENHHFLYYHSGKENADFTRRLERQIAFAERWQAGRPLPEVSQFLVIDSSNENARIFNQLKDALFEFSVIRATSPLDGKSLWVEVFSNGVSKSAGCRWLTERHGITRLECLAIGNDYNDTDLLEWSGESYVVEGAPESLQQRFPGVPSPLESGFSQAVNRWLSKQ